MDTTTQLYTIGEPQLAGALAVFPVFGPPPLLQYRTFAQAVEQGALARELEGAASVRALVIENPTDLPLLVYEGEEVLGAQQNRTFDDSVLVASGEKLRVDVSCVEAGRWDGSRREEPLRPSPQAAYPELRRLKRAAASRTGRADQAEVWAAVGDRLAANGVESPSAAMSDLYESRRAGIAALGKAIRPLDGQLGAVATVAGRPLALDLVSRPDVFASLLPRLAQGYALEALERSIGRSRRGSRRLSRRGPRRAGRERAHARHGSPPRARHAPRDRQRPGERGRACPAVGLPGRPRADSRGLSGTPMSASSVRRLSAALGVSASALALSSCLTPPAEPDVRPRCTAPAGRRAGPGGAQCRRDARLTTAATGRRA